MTTDFTPDLTAIAEQKVDAARDTILKYVSYLPYSLLIFGQIMDRAILRGFNPTKGYLKGTFSIFSDEDISVLKQAIDACLAKRAEILSKSKD